MVRALVLIVTAAAMLGSAAEAGAVELCAALDGSGSIVFSGNDFDLQLDGLASAVEDEAIIPQDGSVTIAVVLFGSYGIAEVPATVVDGQETADGLAAAIRAIRKPTLEDMDFWHRTDMSAAIDTCMSQFQDLTDECIIDISTDGGHNGATDPLAAREIALDDGLDVINAIGVGDADLPFLEELVWPQPAADPPEKGFLVPVSDFAAYVDAMRDKVRLEIPLSVALDLKPRSCPNSFNREKAGVLPVAILGGPNLAVLEIDPSSLLLEGVAPLRWSYEDTAAPSAGPGPEDSCLDCSEAGPDGFTDLTLKFDAEEIAALLAREGAGDCLLLTVTGSLKEEYGGRNLRGDDTLRVVR
jgi:hypothetical protein